MTKQLDNNPQGTANIVDDRVLAVVTPEMEQFASEYGLFIVSIGQKYINALSPDFTTESSLEIFKREYWGRKWY